jgi:methionyl-tRNA formyltransferase
MQIVFMGTPDFAVPALEKIYCSAHQLMAVVTQPDRPKGRHLHLEPPPVKIFAEKNKLSVLQPNDLRDNEFVNVMSGLSPEAIVVVAYGKIIPSWLLNLPLYGCINLHASLLPEYRGAAPIQRVIMDGRAQTGVTTMLLDEGMDTGDIFLQAAVRIGPDETAGEVASRLAAKGAGLLLETLDGLAEHIIEPRKQDESRASYAPKLEKEETLLQWSNPAQKIKDKIRALNPFPGGYTVLRGKRLKVLQARESEAALGQDLEPGTIVAVEKDGIVVASLDKPLMLTVVQPENKRKMSSSEFLQGHRIEVGEKLG